MDLKSKIRRIPEFKGVVFWDITPILSDKDALSECVRRLAHHFRDRQVDLVVSNEARGFIIGTAVAYELGVGFVPIRKEGKLPFKVQRLTYTREYGPDTIEIHTDVIKPGQRILVIDDVLGTGGTIDANVRLVEMFGGQVIGIGCMIELDYLHGRERFKDKCEVFALVHYATREQPAA